MKIRQLLLALAALIIVPSAWGQCHPSSINFAETVNVYFSLTDSTVHQTVDLSGTATMTGGTCQPGITHYARVWNQFNGVGGYTTGPSVCPSCHTEAQSTTSSQFLEGETGVTMDGGDVHCSLAGNFVSVPILSWTNEKAATYSKDMGPSTSVPNSHYLVPWCDSHTDPPDWNPDHLLRTSNTWWPYYSSITWCRRKPNTAGVPWECFGGNMEDPFVYGDTGTTKRFCTKYDAGPAYRQTSDAFHPSEYISNLWLIIRYGLPM